MNEIYDHKEVEAKWRERWETDGIYKVDIENAKKPFYNLMMFPYPSAEGLHVGNVYAFVGSDVYGRFKKLQGYDVFEPIGFDAFGIHSENYAMKIGEHPTELLARNVNHFREDQLKRIGNMFDWEHEVDTTQPDYYKWTQWLFLELYKAGLAEKKEAPVNWCPSCKTVLADEQVESGACERCKTGVVPKQLQQWFFKTTKYAKRLYDNLETIDWSNKTKIAQKNWIGKSVGIDIAYKVIDTDQDITVFTTRPDTNFGATFVVVAPESDFVSKNLDQFEDRLVVEKYVEEAIAKSDIDRISDGRKKTGVFTGLYAHNPLNDRKMPIYVSDFVLANVGTGVVVGVPGHDKRDFEFAQTMGLEIIRVVKDGDNEGEITDISEVQEDRGIMMNSDFLDGMDIMKAKDAIMDYLEKEGMGKRSTHYRLRDWLISRQRYWGPPIPIVHCDSCGMVPVPEKDLPVMLPDMKDFKPDGTGKSPLARSEEFVNTTCPKCGEKATRETDVTDNFLDSAWYFFRYPSTEFSDKPFDSGITKKWLPVDMYIGGNEHAVLHLMYTRFITMVLKDLGHVDSEEPFKKFRAHGLIIKDGAKMSKSKGNVVNPDEYIEKFGADVLRTYLMFLGPYSDGGDFSDRGIFGIVRFYNRLWKFVLDNKGVFAEKESEAVERGRHQLLKKMKEDIEALSYHTVIAKSMEYFRSLEENKEHVTRESVSTILFSLAPFAPHLVEELWENLGNQNSIFTHDLPKHDDAKVQESVVNFVVQVNGKLRDTISLSADVSETEALDLAKNSTKVQVHLSDKEIVKHVFVPGRLINFVVK